MYIYVYQYVYVHVCMCMCMCMHVYVYVHIHRCMCMCMVYAKVCACVLQSLTWSFVASTMIAYYYAVWVVVMLRDTALCCMVPVIATFAAWCCIVLRGAWLLPDSATSRYKQDGVVEGTNS